jgi:hypothetical protein
LVLLWALIVLLYWQTRFYNLSHLSSGNTQTYYYFTYLLLVHLFVLQNTIHCKFPVRYTLTHHSIHSMLEHIYLYTLVYILYFLHNVHNVCTYDTHNVLLTLLLLLDNILVYSLMIDWLFTVLLPAQEYLTNTRRNHCRWRAAKFRPMLGAQVHWAGRDLYRDTPAVTRGLGFSSLIRRIAPFMTHKGVRRIYSSPDPHGTVYSLEFTHTLYTLYTILKVNNMHTWEKNYTTKFNNLINWNKISINWKYINFTSELLVKSAVIFYILAQVLGGMDNEYPPPLLLSS